MSSKRSDALPPGRDQAWLERRKAWEVEFDRARVLAGRAHERVVGSSGEERRQEALVYVALVQAMGTAARFA